MNKSKKHRGNWWQNISTSSKVFCIVCIVCAIAVLTVGYFVKLADPTASSAVNFMEVFCIFVIAIVMAGVLILRTIDTTNLDEIRGEVIKNLNDAHAVHDETKNLLKTEAEYIRDYDEFDGYDLDLEPEERLAKFAVSRRTSGDTPPNEIELGAGEFLEFLSEDEIAALKNEIQANRETAKTAGEDALNARYAKQEKLHNAAIEAKAAEATGDNNHEEPPVGEIGKSNNVVAQFIHGENTGEIDVVTINGIIHSSGPKDKSAEKQKPEQNNQPPTTFLQQLELDRMKDQPDSPENQPKEQPVEQPKKSLSVREQAEEHGVSPSYLQYKFSMAGVTDYDSLSEKDKEDIEEFKRRSSSYAVNL